MSWPQIYVTQLFAGQSTNGFYGKLQFFGERVQGKKPKALMTVEPIVFSDDLLNSIAEKTANTAANFPLPRRMRSNFATQAAGIFLVWSAIWGSLYFLSEDTRKVSSQEFWAIFAALFVIMLLLLLSLYLRALHQVEIGPDCITLGFHWKLVTIRYSDINDVRLRIKYKRWRKRCVAEMEDIWLHIDYQDRSGIGKKIVLSQADNRTFIEDFDLLNLCQTIAYQKSKLK